VFWVIVKGIFSIFSMFLFCFLAKQSKKTLKKHFNYEVCAVYFPFKNRLVSVKWVKKEDKQHFPTALA